MASNTVTINPVVLLNIADSVQRRLSNFGVLRGLSSPSSSSTQVRNSFEVPLTEDGFVDTDFTRERDSLMSQIYADEGGIIGCYVVDDAVESYPPLAESIAHSLLYGGVEVDIKVVLVFSPKKSIAKDGNYFRVFDTAGKELKSTISRSGEEAVNSVLSLKETNSTEASKSKDLINTNKEVMNIIKSKTLLLINSLEGNNGNDPGLSYETLREVNSLVSKLQYKVDDTVKASLLDVENTYKLVQTTGIVHGNTQAMEKAVSDLAPHGRDQM